MSRSTVAGWDTTSDSVKPRKPVVGACDARKRTWVSRPKAALQNAAAAAGSGTSRVTDVMEVVAGLTVVMACPFSWGCRAAGRRRADEQVPVPSVEAHGLTP